jgi:hypothetical protein
MISPEDSPEPEPEPEPEPQPEPVPVPVPEPVSAAQFDAVLAEGKPNSLGSSGLVLSAVLADPGTIPTLLACAAHGEVQVRFRAANVLKKISIADAQSLVPHFDALLLAFTEAGQASALWTLAETSARLAPFLSVGQRAEAVRLMKANLTNSDDWIVLNTTMQVLADWSAQDPALASWITPKLHGLLESRHGSVAKRARKLLGMHA